MENIRESLARLNEGHNFRERANIYAGVALGFLAQIAAVRQMTIPKTDNFVDEVIAWSASVVANIGASLVGKGIPLIYSAGLGMDLGKLGASKLRNRRTDREIALEQKLQDGGRK